MDIKKIIEEFDKFIGIPEEGVKEGQEIAEGLEEKPADMEQAEYKEIDVKEPEVETVAKNLLKEYDECFEKAEYKDMKIVEPEVDGDKKLLKDLEEDIPAETALKQTLEKLYHYLEIEREMHQKGEWGKDEYKDAAHKRTIYDLFDELDRNGIDFRLQNSLIASAQSDNHDFKTWYEQNIAKMESKAESLLSQFKEVFAGNLDIDIPGKVWRAITTTGENDIAVEEGLKDPYIAEQFAKLTDEQIDTEYLELAADITDEEFAKLTRHEKEAFILWSLAWNISDGAYNEDYKEIDRWASEEDVSEEDYLETYEYIYSLLTNGNLEQYREKLKELKADYLLADFKSWCREMAVNPCIDQILNPFPDEELDEKLNEEDIFKYDDQIADIENRIMRLNRQIEQLPPGGDLTDEQGKWFEERRRLEAALKPLKAKRAKLQNESMNEVSDELADNVALTRKIKAQFAQDELAKLDGQHTAELANVERNYTDKQIIAGDADAEIDAIDKKYEPAEDEQRQVIKKAEKNQELMAKRQARKEAQTEAWSVSNFMVRDENFDNEFKPNITLTDIENWLEAKYDELDFIRLEKPEQEELFADEVETIYARYIGKLGEQQFEGVVYKMLINGGEPVNESVMNEISQELADEVNTQRQVNALKAELKAQKDPSEENKEAAEQATEKAQKNIELTKRWKKAKGIKESEVVARFEENNNTHEIVRTQKGKYNIRYNVVEGKARSTRAGVQSLPVAIDALKKRFPEATEVKLNEGMQVPMSEVSAMLGNKVEQERLKRLQKAQDELDDKKAALLNDEENEKVEKEYLDAQLKTDKLADKYLKTAVRNIKRQQESFVTGDKVNHEVFGEGVIVKELSFKNQKLYEVEYNNNKRVNLGKDLKKI